MNKKSKERKKKSELLSKRKKILNKSKNRRADTAEKYNEIYRKLENQGKRQKADKAAERLRKTAKMEDLILTKEEEEKLKEIERELKKRKEES